MTDAEGASVSLSGRHWCWDPSTLLSLLSHPRGPPQGSLGPQGTGKAGTEAASAAFPGGLSHARVSVPLVQSRGWGSGGNQRAQPRTPEQERERGEELSSCFLTAPSQPKLPLANRKRLINTGWMDAWMHEMMDGRMELWMDGWMGG